MAKRQALNWLNSRTLFSGFLTGNEIIPIDSNDTPYEIPIKALRFIPYEDIAYASVVPLDISGNYKNITDVTGNFTVNAANAVKGMDYVFTVKKTVAGVINLTFGTGFTGAAITALKGVNYSSGNVVSLASETANSIYTVTMHFQTEGVIIAVDENRSTDSGLI